MKTSIISLGLWLLLLGCAEQNVNREDDLTLPDFSFIGLSEPLADKENIKISVHVKIPHTELQFIRSGDEYLARYEVAVNLADQDNERISGEIWSDSLRLTEYKESRNSTNTIVTVKTFKVPASELTINVRVTDLYTKKSHVLSSGIDQSLMYSGALSLGNIMILENGTSDKSKLLMNESFYEIIDTLRFNVRLLGDNFPFKLNYELKVRDEIKVNETRLVDHAAPIDSLLNFVVPLTDMHYSNYTLFLTAEDSEGNKAATKVNFRVRIRGVNFDVENMDEAVKQLIYLASDRQIKEMMIGSEIEKTEKFKLFWEALDPTPGTIDNELMEEYYRRIAFSLEAFTVIQEGWKTDRGMIYILFGPPDEIQRGPFELDRKPYQVWQYYHLGKNFVFKDQTGFGDYKLDQSYLDQGDWRFRY
ncbi:MAG: GWxTD domain-containing protein [Candidatus Marinimicrobia bacterium]|nr:GWxTD domain-containing protein [Candidatus Neomarinimicrobiota bacterium]MBT3630302.1 GWxTD domain-containing protein [Candidatus Neomarinimicrobiota bacterium]MBT3824054.1 GWxTD domain-containing protein [Candidatus Neomarinimicrobiota bacterium]MBT4132341.1 GWxTD domain-containing protein [Candidatus Neomarinimicrobiota bacterium]MBT4296388.1 GWxTD domain-containing protein [Candidatus Neomarinimicrobiota bacterium]